MEITTYQTVLLELVSIVQRKLALISGQSSMVVVVPAASTKNAGICCASGWTKKTTTRNKQSDGQESSCNETRDWMAKITKIFA